MDGGLFYSGLQRLGLYRIQGLQWTSRCNGSFPQLIKRPVNLEQPAPALPGTGPSPPIERNASLSWADLPLFAAHTSPSSIITTRCTTASSSSYYCYRLNIRANSPSPLTNHLDHPTETAQYQTPINIRTRTVPVLYPYPAPHRWYPALRLYPYCTPSQSVPYCIVTLRLDTVPFSPQQPDRRGPNLR